MNAGRQRRVTAVWTRNVNPDKLAGRLRTIASIRHAMSSNYSVKNLQLENLLERRSFPAVGKAVLAALGSTFTGTFPSLQCLLFSGSQNHKHLLRDLEDDPPDTLYCDGVRSFYFLRSLGALKEKMRIVVDFDDLMSRRMQNLGSAGISLSLGYLQERVPSYLRKAIALEFASRSLARYECSAVAKAEDDIGHWVDTVTLVSSIEADILRARYRKSGCKAQVYVVSPPTDIVKQPQTYSAFSRFIFIGPDSLPQNRLTIQRIQELWRVVKPSAQIHIFGNMTSRWESVPGVVFRGYASSLEDVYVDGAVLFAPSFLRGGVKTKVAEAFSYGCAAIGNNITFEGLALNNYPLSIENTTELLHTIAYPSLYLAKMREAALEGHAYVKAYLSREQFNNNWKAILG